MQGASQDVKNYCRVPPVGRVEKYSLGISIPASLFKYSALVDVFIEAKLF
jgi:hypothetical protein